MGIFLQFGSILGDVEDAGHTNWIDLQSVNWSLSRPVSNPAGSSAGQVLSAPQLSQLSVTKQQDVATIPLIQAALQGAPVGAQIDFCTTGSGQQQVYYSIVLKNVVITAFSQTGADGRPVESVTLNFTQISFTGTQMDADGSAASPASYGWNISTNQAT
nr:type VI secretion system tube protein Hcp [uncultured Rhodopila sp.]